MGKIGNLAGQHIASDKLISGAVGSVRSWGQAHRRKIQAHRHAGLCLYATRGFRLTRDRWWSHDSGCRACWKQDTGTPNPGFGVAETEAAAIVAIPATVPIFGLSMEAT